MSQAAAHVAGLGGRVAGWQPLTFQERGVAVPFTTPHLAGARLRATDPVGPELLLPAIAGPGSVGILPWEGVGSLCSPTLFDRRLGTRLGALPALSPATVRQAVMEEAAAGLAGSEAQSAAAAARQADAAEIAQAATALACGDVLATLLGPVGVGGEQEAARLPRTLAAVTALADQLDALRPAGALAAEAEPVAAAARRAVAAANEALAAARALAADPPALLRRHAQAPHAVMEQIALADWLLDGWAWLCRLWAYPDARLGRPAVTLPELAALLPALPRLAARAGGMPRQGAADTVRTLQRGGDWRSGVTPQDLIARNERLLTEVLVLPARAP